MAKSQKMDSLLKNVREVNNLIEVRDKYRIISSPVSYPHIFDGKYGVRVLDTYTNLKFLLDQFKALIRYNQMTRRREIIVPGEEFFEDEKDNCSLFHVEHLAKLNFMPHKEVEKHLETLSMKNHYHPVVECIKSKAWDGVLRLDKFIRETLITSQPDLDFFIVKTWMRAAISAAHCTNYGFTNHGVLVIQGEQGIGKTAWVRKLDPTSGGAVKTGGFLEPKNKDSVIGLSRFWIAELGELDGTFNRSDIATLKSFITSDSDFVRVPWGRKEINLIRRTAYVATVNSANFLVDDTGNRRWWTICAKEINYNHDFDMQQVWAEAKVEVDNGALVYLPREIQTLVNSGNENHEVIDPIHELIATRYDWENNSRRDVTATTVLSELGFNKPTRGECMRAGNALCKINGKAGRKSHGVIKHSVAQFLPFS